MKIQTLFQISYAEGKLENHNKVQFLREHHDWNLVSGIIV